MKSILDLIKTIAHPKVIFTAIFFSMLSFLISSNWVISGGVFFIVLPLYGFFNVRYRENEAIINKRNQLPQKFSILSIFEIPTSPYGLHVEEFEYQGFCFKVLRINQDPAQSVSYPLCPKCKGFVVESIKQKFPLRILITFKCNTCNILYPSKFTKAELMQDVAQHFGIPIN